MEPRRVPAGRGWDWITEAWAIFKRNAGTWIGIYVVQLLITMMFGVFPVVGWLSGFLSVILTAGVLIATHRSATGNPISVSNLFDGFKSGKVASLLGTMGYMFLLGFGGMLILIVLGYWLFWGNSAYHDFLQHWSASYANASKNGGTGLGEWFAEFVSSPEYVGFALRVTFLLTVAAVFAVVVLMLYWFAPPIILFENMRAWPAMKKSYRMCAENVWPLTVYGLVMMVLTIIAAIPLALGLLIMGPLTMITQYTSYRDMVGGHVPDLTMPVEVLPSAE